MIRSCGGIDGSVMYGHSSHAHTMVWRPAAMMAPSMMAARLRSGARRWPSRLPPTMSSTWPLRAMASAGEGNGRSMPVIIEWAMRTTPAMRKQAPA